MGICEKVFVWVGILLLNRGIWGEGLFGKSGVFGTGILFPVLGEKGDCCPSGGCVDTLGVLGGLFCIVPVFIRESFS